MDRCVIACFHGDVTTLAHERYGVKTQGFPLSMVKQAKEDTERHYYASGIAMEELVEEYHRKRIDPWCWCPDTDREVEQAAAAGVSLMTVNNPLPALKILGPGKREV